MENIQYVIDENGQPVAVQIPLDKWRAIQAELDDYTSEEETAEILADAPLMEAIKKGREQIKREE